MVAAALVEAVAGGPGEPAGAGLADRRRASRRAAGRARRASPAATRRWGPGSRATNAGPLAAACADVRDRLDEWLALLEAARPRTGLPDEAALPRSGSRPPATRLEGRRVSEEQVLVVPARPDHGRPRLARRSWRPGAAPYLDVIAAEGRFEPRAAMERDPRFKQVIPYLVLRDRGRYFLMRRTRAGGDERLHDRFSIGVGGHLNPGDVDLAGGLAREWTEELAADFVPEFRLLGLLNDDETEVGRVHLGVVYVAEAAGRARRASARRTSWRARSPSRRRSCGRLRPDGDLEPARLRLRERPGRASGSGTRAPGGQVRSGPDTRHSGGPTALVRYLAQEHRMLRRLATLARLLPLVPLGLGTIGPRARRGRPGPRRRRGPRGLGAARRPASSTPSWPATSPTASPRPPARAPRSSSSSSTRRAAASTRPSGSPARSSRREVPVIVWVAPAGGRAASAGTFITLAANLAWMAPGHEHRGRQPDLEQRRGHRRDARREGQERRDREHHGHRPGPRPTRRLGRLHGQRGQELLGRRRRWRPARSTGSPRRSRRSCAAADGRTVTVAGGPAVTLATADAVPVEVPMNPLQGFLHLLSDPNIAFILFTIGFYGLIFEVQNPNFVTGIIGAICILLAFIGFGSLPLNVAGLLLIGLGPRPRPARDAGHEPRPARDRGRRLRRAGRGRPLHGARDADGARTSAVALPVIARRRRH